MAERPDSEYRAQRRAMRRSQVRRRRAVTVVVALSVVSVVASVALLRGLGHVEASEAAVRPVTRHPAVVAKPTTPAAERKGRPSDRARLKLRL